MDGFGGGRGPPPFRDEGPEGPMGRDRGPPHMPLPGTRRCILGLPLWLKLAPAPISCGTPQEHQSMCMTKGGPALQACESPAGTEHAPPLMQFLGTASLCHKPMPGAWHLALHAEVSSAGSLASNEC